MRRLVISDIHGCVRTFKELLNKIGLNKSDSLYLLGDYIDRGPSSSGVLDTIIQLKDENYNLKTIMGNHEQNMLDAFREYSPLMFEGYARKLNNAGDLLDKGGKLIPVYKEFMENLDFYFELDDYWIVHAGFNTDTEDFLEDKKAMLKIRSFRYDPVLLKNKKVVHGHDVKYMKKIMSAIDNDEPIIPLDNGCIYNRPHKKYDYKKAGTLLCFDLDSKDLIQQKNIDI